MFFQPSSTQAFLPLDVSKPFTMNIALTISMNNHFLFTCVLMCESAFFQFCDQMKNVTFSTNKSPSYLLVLMHPAKLNFSRIIIAPGIIHTEEILY